MDESNTAAISDCVHINTGQIPTNVSANLAQMAFNAIIQDYKKPEIQADYQKWKAKRLAENTQNKKR